jgi:general secretion pathway protein F
MAFTVRSLDAAGQIIEQSFEAPSATDARRMAARSGQVVLAVRSAPHRRHRIGGRLDAVVFGRDLAALLRAGLGLVEAIGLLAERQPKPALRARLEAVHARLVEGQRLSAALEADASLLPLFFVASVRSAETTGQLPEALSRFVGYQSRIAALQARLLQTLIYPAVVAIVGTTVVLFLMLWVVPRFADVFADLRVDLPWASRMLLGIGAVIGDNLPAVLITLGFLFAGVVAAASAPALRRAALQRLLSLPGLRGPNRLYRLAIFYRNLGMLLHGGVPLPAAVQMAAPTLGIGLDVSAGIVRDALLRGLGPAEALELGGLTTAESRRMLHVGERSGRLPEMFESVADRHDTELGDLTDRFGRLFEPLVMVVLGLIIGGVVVLLYMPIFDLAGAVG